MVLPVIKHYNNISEILNLEGHQNNVLVTAFLLHGWIWPTGGVALAGSVPAACAAGLFDRVLVPQIFL